MVITAQGRKDNVGVTSYHGCGPREFQLFRYRLRSRRYGQHFQHRCGLENCPHAKPSYSIQIIPCTPTLRHYADGSEKRQYLFVFAMRAPYGESSAVNMRNLAFFERLEQWIGTSTPDLPEGYTAQRVSVLSSGYQMTNGERTALYQIQCRLSYIREAGTLY